MNRSSTGHDHKQHVDRSGNVVEIDGGTLGAGGVVDIGKALAGFAQVHLDATGWPEAVDLIAADPISGDATAQRVRLVEQQTRPREKRATPAAQPPPPLIASAR